MGYEQMFDAKNGGPKIELTRAKDVGKSMMEDALGVRGQLSHEHVASNPGFRSAVDKYLEEKL